MPRSQPLADPPENNRILQVLSVESRARLRDHLEPVHLTAGQVIYNPQAPIETSYFMTRGLVSLVKRTRDGRTVEIGAIGTEGVTGPDTLFGVHRALLECIVRVPGTALRIRSDILRNEMSASPQFQRLMQRFIQTVFSQIAQTAACNRLHSLEERCCRWLLTAHDCAFSDTFSLTHEFLAMLLGAQRAGVSLKVNRLQKAGMIRYSRGSMRIVDRPRLQSASCECYDVIRGLHEIMFAALR